MGYNGFGMQRWISNLKPRKPFSNDRKSSGDTIPKYSREFILRKDESQISPRIKAIISFIILIVIFSLIGFFFSQIKDFGEKQSIKTNQNIYENNNNLSLVLLNSGRSYFNHGDFINAKSEFELALKISPSNYELNKIYILTLLKLAEKKQIENNLLLTQINKTIEGFPNKSELIKLKSEYYFLTGDTLSAISELDKIEIKY